MAQKIYKGRTFTNRTFNGMTVFKRSRFKSPNYFNGYTVLDQATFIPSNNPTANATPNIVRGYAVVNNSILNNVTFIGPSTISSNTIIGENVTRLGPKIDKTVLINSPTIHNKKICNQSCDQLEPIINPEPIRDTRIK